MTDYSLIFCIVNIGHASKALKFARNYGVKGGTIYYGRGTSRNRFLEFLELHEVRKEILIMVVESELASDAIKGISKDMEFHKANHGIAFLLCVAEFIGSKNENICRGTCEECESMYKLIYTIVEKGRAEEVVDAANKVGSTGATIINARGAGPHEVQKLFSIEVEPEKEKVLIIAKNDVKDAVVQSIRKDLNIDEPGRGILFVLDVNEVYGMHMS